jgi:hypothetical protein
MYNALLLTCSQYSTVLGQNSEFLIFRHFYCVFLISPEINIVFFRFLSQSPKIFFSFSFSVIFRSNTVSLHPVMCLHVLCCASSAAAVAHHLPGKAMLASCVLHAPQATAQPASSHAGGACSGSPWLPCMLWVRC